MTVTDQPLTERAVAERPVAERPRQGDRSVPDLLREMVDETRAILRDEVRLAKTETSEKVSRVGNELAQIGIGAAVGIVALIALGTAVTLAMISLFGQFMELEVAMWLGPLVLGAVLLIVAVVVAKKGIERLKRESVLPEKTVATLKEDKAWIRAQTR